MLWTLVLRDDLSPDPPDAGELFIAQVAVTVDPDDGTFGFDGDSKPVQEVVQWTVAVDHGAEGA